MYVDLETGDIGQFGLEHWTSSFFLIILHHPRVMSFAHDSLEALDVL